MKTKKSNSNIEVYENLYPFSLSVASINDIEEINNKYYFYNNISDYLNYSNKIEIAMAAKTIAVQISKYFTILLFWRNLLVNLAEITATIE